LCHLAGWWKVSRLIVKLSYFIAVPTTSLTPLEPSPCSTLTNAQRLRLLKFSGMITKTSCITVSIEAYRSNAMFTCDIFLSLFSRVLKRQKTMWKCFRIFGFNSLSRQFVTNAFEFRQA